MRTEADFYQLFTSVFDFKRVMAMDACYSVPLVRHAMLMQFHDQLFHITESPYWKSTGAPFQSRAQ